MTAMATLAMVSLDCDNPPALATFYHELLGWEITHSQDEYAMISPPAGAPIGFGKVDDYRAPRWPAADAPKQYHFDFYVEELDKAVQQALELGAAKPEFQPGGDRWRVLTDPAGHPFCLCLKS